MRREDRGLARAGDARAGALEHKSHVDRLADAHARVEVGGLSLMMIMNKCIDVFVISILTSVPIDDNVYLPGALP